MDGNGIEPSRFSQMTLNKVKDLTGSDRGCETFENGMERQDLWQISNGA